MPLGDVRAHHVGHGAAAAERCRDQNKRELRNQFHSDAPRSRARTLLVWRAIDVELIVTPQTKSFIGEFRQPDGARASGLCGERASRLLA